MEYDTNTGDRRSSRENHARSVDPLVNGVLQENANRQLVVVDHFYFSGRQLHLHVCMYIVYSSYRLEPLGTSERATINQLTNQINQLVKSINQPNQSE